MLNTSPIEARNVPENGADVAEIGPPTCCSWPALSISETVALIVPAGQACAVVKLGVTVPAPDVGFSVSPPVFDPSGGLGTCAWAAAGTRSTAPIAAPTRPARTADRFRRIVSIED